jgi:protoporphyrinogen oxidase
VFTAGRPWHFTTPLDLLRFKPLPVLDRLHTGVGALRLARVKEWEALDRIPALQWLERYTGRRAAEIVWEPLLRAKFGASAPSVPAAWMYGRFEQRAGARSRGGERLGYLRGGFRQLFEALHAELERLGVDIRTGAAVSRIVTSGSRVVGIDLGAERVEADAVLYAGALPGLSRLVSEDEADPRWSAIGGLGVLCVVLELDRPISDIYWTNVCDRDLAFGGVIEHTNLLPLSDYGGRRVVYLSRYFLADEPIASAAPHDEAERWIDQLEERFSGFSRRGLLAVHPFRTPYAAPLVTVGHFGRIPPLRSHIDGLYLCTTAQIYPQDRGMSEGVRTGMEAAAVIHADAERVGGSV